MQLPQDAGVIGNESCPQENGDSSMQNELREMMSGAHDKYDNVDVPEDEEELQTNQTKALSWIGILLPCMLPTDQDVPLFQAAQIQRKEATQRLEAAYRVANEDFKRYTDE